MSSGNVLTHEIEVMDERGLITTILIPAERALTVFLDDFELVTLMTLGMAPCALTLGYLRNQRLIQSPSDIEAIQMDWETETVRVKTNAKIHDIVERTSRRVITTGCGQGSIYGGLLDGVDDIRLDPHARIKKSVIYHIVGEVRKQPSVYKQARAVHACALFSLNGELCYFVEDVGRHNAVDAIAGMMWQDGLKGEEHALYTTGRLTSEMVIKAAQIGIPCLLSRSGMTEIGHSLAARLGMTLLTRCSGVHFLAITRPDRIIWA